MAVRFCEILYCEDHHIESAADVVEDYSVNAFDMIDVNNESLFGRPSARAAAEFYGEIFDIAADFEGCDLILHDRRE